MPKLVAVEIGDGKGNALAMIIGHDDDELPRPRRPGHCRVVDFEQKRSIRKIPPRLDGESGRRNAIMFRAGNRVLSACHPLMPVIAIGHVWVPPPSESQPKS
jgi:hypothetical protein